MGSLSGCREASPNVLCVEAIVLFEGLRLAEKMSVSHIMALGDSLFLI